MASHSMPSVVGTRAKVTIRHTWPWRMYQGEKLRVSTSSPLRSIMLNSQMMALATTI